MALPDIKIRFGVDSEPAVRGVNRVNQSLVRTQRAAREGSRRMTAATSSSRRMGFAAQNAAFQVGDFAVQVAAGTSASRAMAQQLPQLLGGLGLMGAVLGAAAAILVPLVAHFYQGADAAENMARAVDTAKSSLSGAQGAFSGAQTQVTALRDLAREYKTAIVAAGNASGPAAQAVIANTAKEFGQRKKLLALELDIIDARSGDTRANLANLQEQQRLMLQARTEKVSTEFAMARARIDRQAMSDTERTARLGQLKLFELNRLQPEGLLGPESFKVFEDRQRDIQRMTAELGILDLQTSELAETLKTEFPGGIETAVVQGVGTGAGHAGGGAAGAAWPAARNRRSRP